MRRRVTDGPWRALAIASVVSAAATFLAPGCGSPSEVGNEQGTGQGASADGGALGDADPGTAQRPPRGQTALEPWLAAGFFRHWTCEAGISPVRLDGSHGRHRICANEQLLGSGAGPYPVGAASVKELFAGAEDRPNGFAVGLKVAEGDGTATWYWYERRGSDPTTAPLADGEGVPECAVCHGAAVRDNVFIRPGSAAAP